MHDDRTISRRKMLERMAVGGAVVWSVPIVSSLNATAAAASPHQPEPPRTDVRTAAKDSNIRSGVNDRNFGGDDRIRIQASGNNRGLVAFDLSAVSLTGLQSATLNLTVQSIANNWGQEPERTLDVHRLTRDWTEGNGTESDRGTGAGVTWRCATDTDISNTAANCAPAWTTQGGDFAAATATPVTVHPTTTPAGAVLTWDVTADVLAGAGFGWLVKKTSESQSGEIHLHTREGPAGSVPTLVLSYA